MRVNKDSPLPRYVQARKYLEDMITESGLGPGDQLPAERDLAAQFQVSQMTMNRAIQDLVRDGILFREVGRGTFVVHQDGRGTRKGALALATLFSPGVIKSDPYGSEILRGVQAAAFESFWDLVLVRESLDDPEGLIARLRGRADGILFMSPADETIPALLRIRAAGVPILCVGSSWEDVSISAVDTDNIQGATLAMEHLISLEHTRIAMMGAPENMSNSRDRHIGFRAALEAHGLEYRPEWFLACGSAVVVTESERLQLLEMLRGPDAPTAIFAAGYVLAVSAIETIQSAGLSVPEDYSVVGFDDKFSAAFLNPPLTTVAQPLEDMGRHAVERLEAVLSGERSALSVERLSTTLIVRQSTAARR